MKTVFVAGATGYLGRYLCAEYSRRGWYVIALVRNVQTAGPLTADSIVEAQATLPDSLIGLMDGADLVVSALGITRQTDGLSYRDVDFQANINLLRAAERAGVRQFAYIHVLNADAMRQVPLVAAKTAFVDALKASLINETIVAPSGYFSDMGEVLSMAQSGRIWLFGTGHARINPIHGADLATVVADATDAERKWVDAGGPETFTQTQLAECAFKAISRPSRIAYLPDALRKFLLSVLPWVTPRRILGPLQFFLTATTMDMVGPAYGEIRLSQHFQTQANSTQDKPQGATP
ncbi:SDR family oxidoreductase [Marivita sp. XM-24bin2]|jgi:uncharacterized protein YbjT (DUF2867 family)|uniref:SDR family oxidoreductase n=1 Tax=unclassified Marivita TaxID=2632480 RepID=UPI000D7AD441|nr:SDR family oxidoreductase [Marivita sp. XM-24bin2]MCR9108905.1 SDR family oxidoreductase [Paracoccaceae bacterium]PWL34962.1 MAG: NAD(P)-dependent oxidoreductase [Marivita sp. XM-24bin2]